MVTETSYTFISIRLDEREFHNVFDKYYVALCLFANQYTENEEVSADIVQDSFAKLWQIREDFFYLHRSEEHSLNSSHPTTSPMPSSA